MTRAHEAYMVSLSTADGLGLRNNNHQSKHFSEDPAFNVCLNTKKRLNTLLGKKPVTV